jgi:FkbM family methyltransferase
MIEHLGWWFPDGETHFQKMLNKSVTKGGPARYQYQVRDRSFNYCTQRRVALDIGANVGLWTRDMCDVFDNVLAFEPVAMFRECLIKNVVKGNLTVEPVALGDKETLINMIITEDNMGHTHIDPASFGQGTIPVRRLDSLEFSVIDYIKIDCEGFEYQIIQGAEQTIRRCRPIIVVEQKPHGTYNDNQYAAVDLLQTFGMRRLDGVKDDWIMGW